MKSSDLRQKAEIRLLERQLETGVVHSEAEAQRVVHELEVHQIELEMVNEELVIANELAIKLAKNKYIELYDFAPNGYLTISKGGEIIELTLAAAEILGKDSLQLKNCLFGFFIHEYSKQVFSEFLDKIFDQRVKRFCDLTLICRNNTTFYVTLAGIADKNGEKAKQVDELVIANLNKDIQREILRKSQQQYHNLVENASVGIFVAQGEYIRFANT